MKKIEFTIASQEALRILQEECAEVIQATSKIFRFGLESKHPNENRNNIERLEEELGDLEAMISILIEQGVVQEDKILDAKSKKYDKLRIWSTILR
jgi:NTP pyrophosphatase (non-canonical NTP hydrolase)